MQTNAFNKYMDQHHPDAFKDWPVCTPMYQFTKPCPKCKTHGGWNLKLNAYGLPDGYEDTAENRHRYCHFRSTCGHCNGWGYVDPEEMCVGHEWKRVRSTGRCLTLYKCVLCDKEWEVDSSD